MIWLFFLTIVQAQWVETNLTARRSSEFPDWCVIRFQDDHHGWSANQPSNEWTSILMFPDKNVSKVQITACDQFGNPGLGPAARIMDPSFTTVLYFAVQYRLGPWNLYVSLKHCDYAIWPGIPPERQKEVHSVNSDTNKMLRHQVLLFCQILNQIMPTIDDISERSFDLLCDRNEETYGSKRIVQS